MYLRKGSSDETDSTMRDNLLLLTECIRV
jgi:hypothetical protein